MNVAPRELARHDLAERRAHLLERRLPLRLRQGRLEGLRGGVPALAVLAGVHEGEPRLRGLSRRPSPDFRAGSGAAAARVEADHRRRSTSAKEPLRIVLTPRAKRRTRATTYAVSEIAVCSASRFLSISLRCPTIRYFAPSHEGLRDAHLVGRLLGAAPRDRRRRAREDGQRGVEVDRDVGEPLLVVLLLDHALAVLAQQRLDGAARPPARTSRRSRPAAASSGRDLASGVAGVQRRAVTFRAA